MLGGAAEKVELFERVDDGWTGPRERRERAKSGSEASRDIAFVDQRTEGQNENFLGSLHSSLVSLACDWGCIVGPGADG